MPSQALKQGDEADRIVETLLKDPARAEDVKALLRQRLSDDGVVHLQPSRERFSPVDEAAEDMWDNLPV